ncbi:Inorganic triphosphatase YgiF, contains CYTH and CHAD domains [Variovorax sp. HW608]|uniref:CYTH and CHAD domain-containing protein n=1 Tax=Variovorax sp. HW608 TaxID=1034889 RepID=UPI00081F8523|nr:CYTH and CHAD domain-containing protein [Variovorax sp. HW608]SCK43926.1 Inorganic triphosphatase YgiF, contains CYTH and CHAD domains [Variovorax sp. HW608]
MTEFELKFQISPSQRSAVEAAVGRGRSHVTRLRARYFDTADGALAAQHIVLRLRKEGRTWWQTAKAPGGTLLERHEHNVELPPVSAREVPVPRIERHEGTPVGALIHEALRKAGHDPATVELAAVYGTDVRRTTREMRTGDALVELAFDQGEVSAGERSHALCELEIELKSGSPHSMLELAHRWRNRYALWLDTVSKSARGQRLAQGASFGDPVKAVPPSLDDDSDDGPQVLCAVIKTCLSQILANASEVAAGSTDAEHVHQLRVGIRRLRTALREMEALAPSLIDPAWESALVTAFRALGRQRDRDHLLQDVQPRLEAVGAPPIAWADAAPPPDPADVVRSAEFQNTLLELVAATLPTETADDDAAAEEPAAQPAPARKPLRKRLSKLHRQVVRDGQRYEALEPAAQHRVRKRLKRLRYLGEFVAPMFGSRDAKRYLKKLEPAQDALGQHNDNAVAISAYRDNASHDGQSWFAVGWLSARQPASAVQCREALDEVAKAQPFWK